jgi:demethylmenaquinone methyltransferase/2-methoxy-6-polyprenyl-1,4-benzoquinol methylase
VPKELQQYYSRRASEYEEIYQKQERQQDLTRLKIILCDLLRGHRILELACGTGYWTEVIAAVAQSIVATDTSEEVIAIAKRKVYPPNRVQFVLADAYALDSVPGSLSEFLHGFHRRLGNGAHVVFIDNRYVEGSSTPIAGQDEAGNTYQVRPLRDGPQYRVLKNFPSAEEVRVVLNSLSLGLEVLELDYYWCASYRVATR